MTVARGAVAMCSARRRRTRMHCGEAFRSTRDPRLYPPLHPFPSGSTKAAYRQPRRDAAYRAVPDAVEPCSIIRWSDAGTAAPLN